MVRYSNCSFGPHIRLVVSIYFVHVAFCLWYRAEWFSTSVLLYLDLFSHVHSYILVNGQPANDQCGSPLTLSVNTPVIVGTTVNATTDSYCARSGIDPVGRGVWYLLLGTGNIMTISTCSEETTYDSRLAIHSSCTGSCYVSEDPGIMIPTCLNPFGRQVTFDSTLGSLYYVFVFSATTATVGDFGISVVDYQRPQTTSCNQALPIVVNGPELIGTTVNATREEYCFRAGTDPQGRGAWYVVGGTGNVMTVSTCSMATTFDSRLAVQSLTCSGGCVTSRDPGFAISACSNPFGRQITFDSTVGRLYYIFVLGATRSVVGNFGLNVVDYERPENDWCSNARSILVNGPEVTGTTVNSTRDSYCFRAGADPVGRGVWYVTTGTGNIMTASTCTSNTTYDSRLAVQRASCEGSCVSGQEVGAIVEPCTNPFGRTVTFYGRFGELYYIYVHGALESTVGEFGLSIVDYQSPAHDFCVNAEALQTNGPEIIASTVNASLDNYCFRAGADPLARGVWYVVIGGGSDLTISTCSANTLVNMNIYIQSGSCTSSCISSATATLCETNTFGKTYTWNAALGTAYYIFIAGATRIGQFGLRLSDNSTTTVAPTDLPPSMSPVVALTDPPTTNAPVMLTNPPTTNAPILTTNSPTTGTLISTNSPTTIPSPRTDPPTPALLTFPPSTVPTNLPPTLSPTELPTVMASMTPSVVPTEEPSSLPSVVPTEEPSSSPSPPPMEEATVTVQPTSGAAAVGSSSTSFVLQRFVVGTAITIAVALLNL